MPSTIPQKPRIDIQEIYRLSDQGLTQRAVASQLQCDQSYVSQTLKARRLKGAPPEPTAGIPVSLVPVNGAPLSAPLSAPDSAPRFDELEQRVQVLEAFMASLPRHPAHFIGALNGAPRSAPASATKKRGFVIACDLSDALDTYASASGQRVTDILDRALRLYLGEVAGTEVHP